MSLKHWDSVIAPQLRLIEEASIQIQSRSGWIITAVKSLPARPWFQSHAMGELDRAEIMLEQALAAVRKAKAAYPAIQVIPEHMKEAAE